MARTQQQRRDETVARLIDACIDTIIDVGYARASAATITKRAGVSVGALFRHFDTMGDFMAATAREVLRRQIEMGAKLAAEIGADRPAVESLLTILRDVTHSPVDAVVHEMMVAARTDEKLRATLQEVLTEFDTKIFDAVRASADFENIPDETLGLVVLTLINTFDGAAIASVVRPRPEIGTQQITLLASLLEEAYGR